MDDNPYLTTDADGRLWYTETLHKGFRARYEVADVVYDSKTPHQRLMVFDTVAFGRLMSLDGITQVTMADEYVYHEMLSHLPILAHGDVKDVLIIGGGDGGLAEEVLKHEGIERLVMVEIDAGVIDFARTHWQALNHNCFDDPRFRPVIADGKDYVATSKDRFDVIVIDSTDPVGPGEVLFTKNFYADCKSLLKPGGVLLTQNGVPFFQADELKNTVYNFSKLFADAGCYLAVIPTYVGGFMALGWGTDNVALRSVPLETLKARFAALGIKTRYYTPELHAAAFALPAFIAEMVETARTQAAG